MDEHRRSVTEGTPAVPSPSAPAPTRARRPRPLRPIRATPSLALLLPPVAFLALFFVYPVATIVATGLVPEGRVELDALASVLTDPGLAGVAWFTLWQATLSTILTVFVALPGAYVFARYDFPGKRLLRAAAVVPFVLPTVVVGAAFLALLGPRSPVNELLMALLGLDEPPLQLHQTVWAILVAHVFYNYAVVLRIVGGSWSHLPPRLEEAALALGASRLRAFREVTLPLLKPAIAAASSIVFLFTFTSFGVVLILGGPAVATLEVEIYRQTAQLLDLRVAAALTIVQMAAVMSILAVYSRYQQRHAVAHRLAAAGDVARRPRTSAERLVVTGNVALMLFLLGLPLVVLAERSLAGPDGYGLDHYRRLWEDPRGGTLFVAPAEALTNSAVFAAATAIIALVLGLLTSAALADATASASRWFDALVMLPLGTSAVMVGFGFLLALDTPPLDLRTSPLLIVIAHSLIAIPFVVRATLPVIRSIDRRLREAAAVLGAGPLRAWREVDLPIVTRAALVGGGFAIAVSLGEFGATVFIARPDVPTLPVAVFRLLARPGATNFGQAMALSTVLMLVTAAAVLLIERFRIGTGADF